MGLIGFFCYWLRDRGLVLIVLASKMSLLLCCLFWLNFLFQFSNVPLLRKPYLNQWLVRPTVVSSSKLKIVSGLWHGLKVGFLLIWLIDRMLLASLSCASTDTMLSLASSFLFFRNVFLSFWAGPRELERSLLLTKIYIIKQLTLDEPAKEQLSTFFFFAVSTSCTFFGENSLSFSYFYGFTVTICWFSFSGDSKCTSKTSSKFSKNSSVLMCLILLVIGEVVFWIFWLMLFRTGSWWTDVIWTLAVADNLNDKCWWVPLLIVGVPSSRSNAIEGVASINLKY